jgi:hypothetical protein
LDASLDLVNLHLSCLAPVWKINVQRLSGAADSLPNLIDAQML